MAKDKKMVDAITSMDEDFAKWYTDICMKAELVSYHYDIDSMINLIFKIYFYVRIFYL